MDERTTKIRGRNALLIDNLIIVHIIGAAVFKRRLDGLQKGKDEGKEEHRVDCA